jgi:hypothetical protein
VEALLDGPLRYGELADAVTGIAEHPGAAEAAGAGRAGHGHAVLRSSPAAPVRLGRRAGPRRGAGRAGGVGSRSRPSGAPTATCGTALESRPWCPTCSRAWTTPKPTTSTRVAAPRRRRPQPRSLCVCAGKRPTAQPVRAHGDTPRTAVHGMAAMGRAGVGAGVLAGVDDLGLRTPRRRSG